MRRPIKTQFGTWETRTGFVASKELEDGREFNLTFVECSNSATWEDPAESEVFDEKYFIDDVEYEWDKLPADVKDQVDITVMQNDATPDPNFDFGDDDGS